jgi:hypothetical protein
MASPTEEIEVGKKGGMGSKVPWWELMDYRALDTIAQVFTNGAVKYAVDNWRAVPWQEHIRHAVRHAYKSLEDQQQQHLTTNPPDQELDELSHAACRMLMALAVYLQASGVEDRVAKGLAVDAPLRKNDCKVVPIKRDDRRDDWGALLPRFMVVN